MPHRATVDVIEAVPIEPVGCPQRLGDLAPARFYFAFGPAHVDALAEHQSVLATGSPSLNAGRHRPRFTARDHGAFGGFAFGRRVGDRGIAHLARWRDGSGAVRTVLLS